MRESEVLDIVTDKWLSQPTNDEAQITSCEEMGRRILVKVITRLNFPLGKEAREMIFRMNKAKSRMSYFRLLGPINVVDQFRFTSLLILYESCEAGIKYIYDHYDDTSPQAKKLRKDFTKEELKAVVDKFDTQIQKRISELTATGQALTSDKEFQTMDQLFGLVMFLILGEKAIEELISEFNKTLPILKRRISELALKKKRGEIIA